MQLTLHQAFKPLHASGIMVRPQAPRRKPYPKTRAQPSHELGSSGDAGAEFLNQLKGANLPPAASATEKLEGGCCGGGGGGPTTMEVGGLQGLGLAWVAAANLQDAARHSVEDHDSATCVRCRARRLRLPRQAVTVAAAAGAGAAPAAT